MKLAKMLGVKMDADWLSERPDGGIDGMPDGSSHWRCRMRCGKRRATFYYSMGPACDGTPEADDVLDSLLSDAMVSHDFAEFCGDFGYDEDSRKAERTHKACLAARAKLAQLIGREDFADIYNEANQ